MSQPENSTHDDPVATALDRLIHVLRRSIDRHRQAISKAREALRARREGRPYREVVAGESRPKLVELLTGLVRDLQEQTSKVRRAEARALREEGMTQEEIASVFGVTRQRVGALLRASEGGEPSNGDDTGNGQDRRQE